MIKFYNVKVHFTHKKRIKELYQDGFGVQELAEMYKVPPYVIQNITQGLKKAERI